MGITGLITFIKNKEGRPSAIRHGHINEFRGKRAAVDTYSWLHKSIYSCARALFHGIDTNAYIDYCLRLVKLLLDYGIQPVLVFDGDRMPFKVVEENRKNDRENARKRANDLLVLDKPTEAYRYMAQAVDVTHAMAYKLMEKARAIGVECLVAPYEADAQLAYLEKENYVDFVITEDSDLIVLGCKKVFFKMKSSGHGEIYEKEKLEASLRCKGLRFSTFDFDKFRRAAILSGCDYIKSLPGIGLMKAWKFMTMTVITNVRHLLIKIPHYLRMPIKVDEDYINQFILAEMAFLHQVVFDPLTRKRIPLNKWEEENNDIKVFLSNFPAKDLDPLQHALGNIDSAHKCYGNFVLQKTVKPSVFFDAPVQSESPVEICTSIRESPSMNTSFTAIEKKRKRIMENVLEKEPIPNDADDDISMFAFYRKLSFENISALRVKPDDVTGQPEQSKKVKKCKFAKAEVDEEAEESIFFDDCKEIVDVECEVEILNTPSVSPIDLECAAPSDNALLAFDKITKEDEKAAIVPVEANSVSEELPTSSQDNKENNVSKGNEIVHDLTKNEVSPILNKLDLTQISVIKKKKATLSKNKLPKQTSIKNYFTKK